MQNKHLMEFAQFLFIQNGAIIVQGTGNAAETGSEEGAAPYSDFPEQDVTHS